MAKAMMLALSNPVSADREAEFNDWYNNVHAKELLALPGFHSVRRMKGVRQMLPPSEGGKLLYRYAALYEVDDAAEAIDLILKHNSSFQMSDAMDFGGAMGIAFEEIFFTENKS